MDRRKRIAKPYNAFLRLRRKKAGNGKNRELK